MLKILSASNVIKLEEDVKGYDVTQLGSLTISNGHYFLCFLGEPKVHLSLPEEEEPAIEEPKVNISLPKDIVKPRAKRKPKA
jgi:hypothetical protein